MDRTMVDGVRRFNRTVTQRIGALEDAYLSHGRPLGQSRVLWEIGPEGKEVRTLRARLGLDSGYLSRLLRALETEGLVLVTPDHADARVRSARLTPAGLAERTRLDRHSDRLAATILTPLSVAQRARLVGAMAEVERLLTASMVDVTVTDPRHADARWCIETFVAELARRFDGGFDPDRSISASDDQLTPPSGMLLVARLHGSPVGCGALKVRRGFAEVKRMWVSPGVRGLGLGRRLLSELESRAAALGVPTLRLETNLALTEAIALYRSAGYREVPPFNDERYAHHWFEKTLSADAAH
jgi:DNA-binding MarR family transcriptional regulator/N-acetylglutamate synthase-like GNAT family acetyltransferase